MYQFEEATNDEEIALVKLLNAIYHPAWAKEASEGGVDELIKSIGKKILNPNSEIINNMA